MKLKQLVVGLVLGGLLLSAQAYAGFLTLGGVAVNQRGETLSTTCVNTTGYYVEIGKPKPDLKNLTVYEISGTLSLHQFIKTLLLTGWRVHYGPHVQQRAKVTRDTQHRTWSQWLQRIAFQKNLAIVVDWSTRTLYVNRL